MLYNVVYTIDNQPNRDPRRKETKMKYHVTPKWNEKELQTAAKLLGEAEAIAMFMEKWETEDASWAADQVHKLFFFDRLSDAQDYQDVVGGEILEINADGYEFFVDYHEGYTYTDETISISDIKRVNQ